MVLQIGIIGLGRRWRKTYLPILRKLEELFRITAVCDALPEGALQEAQHLGCAAAAGPTNLLERPDVAAALLLDPQWYRLWPVQAACRLGKPIFCDPPLETDDEHADQLLQQVYGQTPHLPVMMAFPFRLAPAMKFLHKLVQNELGPVRAALALAVEPLPHPPPGPGGAHPILPMGTPWLDLCSQFLDQDPVRAASITGNQQEWHCTFLNDRQGGTIQLTWFPTGRRNRPRLRRLTLLCARGTATAELPALVHWSGPVGQHTVCLKPAQSPTRLLLEAFHRCLTQGQAVAPSLQEAHRLLRWLRLVRPTRLGV